jgi:hypothetical protein
MSNPLTLTDPTGACIPDMEGRGGCGLDVETISWEAYKRTQAPVFEELLSQGVPENVARYTAFLSRYYGPRAEPPDAKPLTLSCGAGCSVSWANGPICSIDSWGACPNEPTRPAAGWGFVEDVANTAGDWVSDPANIADVVQLGAGVGVGVTCVGTVGAGCVIAGGIYLTASGVKAYYANERGGGTAAAISLTSSTIGWYATRDSRTGIIIVNAAGIALERYMSDTRPADLKAEQRWIRLYSDSSITIRK